MPFGEALIVARSHGLASMREWEAWSKEGLRPTNVPSHPNRTYKDAGWQGWGHWLDSSNLQTKLFLPFKEALAVARSLGLPGRTEWRVWSKEGLRPANVPSAPIKVYKNHGWQGWGHWLGTGNTQTKQFLPFEEALAVARSLRLPGRMEWQVWSKEGLRPANIPANPNRVYKDHGWQGWGHWQDTGNQAGGQQASHFLPFAEALTVTHSLGLPSRMEWKVWSKEGLRPVNVPSNPDAVYKDHGWQGWGHWLGTGNTSGARAKNFLPFDEALCAARQLRLVSKKEWQLWCKSCARPANVPARPDLAYVHDGWMGWVHWLCHANLDSAAPATAPRRIGKRKPGAGGARSAGKGEGKRQRR